MSSQDRVTGRLARRHRLEPPEPDGVGTGRDSIGGPNGDMLWDTAPGVRAF
ncbi:hypothetical protein AB0M34_36475 [Nocardia sp. NPDC050193]